MKKVINLFCAVFIAGNVCIAQDIVLSPTVIASAGNYSESTELSLSWTLGELAVTTLNSDNLILTQGFQQAFLRGTGFKSNPIEWNIDAYPNPVISELKINFSMPASDAFIIDIQDVTGRSLNQLQYKKVFPGDLITLNMSEYSTGIYFIRVSTTDRKQIRVLTVSKE